MASEAPEAAGYLSDGNDGSDVDSVLGEGDGEVMTATATETLTEKSVGIGTLGGVSLGASASEQMQMRMQLQMQVQMQMQVQNDGGKLPSPALSSQQRGSTSTVSTVSTVEHGGGQGGYISDPGDNGGRVTFANFR